MGIVNLFLLASVRKHLNDPPLQEKVLWGLFTPLMFGDFTHLAVTLWALGDERWNIYTWSPMMWTNVVIGSSLTIPRICWHLGIKRYVDARDGNYKKRSSRVDAKDG
jgi:hypothetical protein